MNDHSQDSVGYRATFKTNGAIRGAAFDLAASLRNTNLYDLACELHDSICIALPGPADTPAHERRAPETTSGNKSAALAAVRHWIERQRKMLSKAGHTHGGHAHDLYVLETDIDEALRTQIEPPAGQP